MFSRLFKLFALSGLVLLYSGLPLLAASSTAPKTISEIQVDGNQTIAGEDIISWLKVKKGDDAQAVRMVLDRDLKAIWETGKFDDVQFLLQPLSDGSTRLLVRIQEKPLIRDITFQGNDNFSAKKLLEESGLVTGIPYDAFSVNSATQKMIAFYHDKEYYEATLQTQTEEDEKGVALIIRIKEGLKVKVTKIEVTGNEAFSAGDIKGAMETKEAGWFVGGVYKEATFIDDLKRILLRYAKEGYLKAKLFGYGLQDIELNRKKIVPQALKVNTETKEMTIHLVVDEGTQFTIGQLEISGNIIFAEEELFRRMALKPGTILDRLIFEQDMQMIRMTYAEKGYIFADVSPEMKYQDDAGTVDISIVVREGSIARVERVDIRGNNITKDKVIRREIWVEPGEAFDSRKIQRSRERISNLGFFQDVKVNTEPGSSPSEQVLVFDVEERHTGTISLGAGYSSVDYLMGYLQLSQANLFGNGQSVSLQWELGALRQSWQMSFTEPWLFDAPVSFGVDIWNMNKNRGYNSQNYNLLSQGGAIRLGRRFNEFWKGFFTYKLESNEYTDVDFLVSGIIPGRSDTSSVTPALLYDSRDNVFDPYQGMYQRLSVELAGGLLGGDNNYMKYLLDSTFYLPLVGKFVLALHGEAGYAYSYPYGIVTTENDVPPSERFRVGGTDSVRGYREGIFGSDLTGGGGRFKLVTNTEIHFPIIGPLKGVAFFDAGNVWSDINGNPGDYEGNNVFFENHTFFTDYPSLYKGAGFGIRLNVPGTVILIRFDFGYPLDPDPDGRPPTLNYHFNIGNIF